MNWLRRHRLLLQQQAALGLVLLALLSVAALLLAEWITGARPPSAELAIGRLLFLLLFVAATVGAALHLAIRAHRRLGQRLERLRQLAHGSLVPFPADPSELSPTAGDSTLDSQQSLAHDALAQAEAAQEAVQKQLEALRQSAWQRSTQLATNAQSLLQALEQVAQIAKQPIDQTAISIETTSSNAIVLAERAKEAHEFTDSARVHAEQGVRVVEAAGREIQHVSTVVDQTAQTLLALSQKTASISSIVSVIKDVADQTKVLSLNAAIEAARAGKHGGGFSAVADAVRRLADRTAQSTRQVTTIIEGIEHETQRAVSTMQQALQGVASSLALSRQAGRVLEQIHSGAKRSESTVRGIADATAELSTASLNLATQISSLAQGIRKGNRLAQRANGDAKQLLSGLEDLRQQLAPQAASEPPSEPPAKPSV
ncbi:MAG: hypothetical protein JNJ46_14720 [Myxococcales bacterium]|nr:hypothetical protein [Myxococcales bacterium]